mgnify:CR=1 FL=1
MDIIYLKKNGKKLTKEEFEQSYNTANELMNELLDKKNIFVNRNLIDYNMIKKEINGDK